MEGSEGHSSSPIINETRHYMHAICHVGCIKSCVIIHKPPLIGVEEWWKRSGMIGSVERRIERELEKKTNHSFHQTRKIVSSKSHPGVKREKTSWDIPLEGFQL